VRSSPSIAARVGLLLALAAAGPARAMTFTASPESGRVVVHAFKRGLFSAFAHDHHFDVTRWRATADVPDGDPSAASLEVTLSAGSLRDAQKALSAGDKRKVDAQTAGPEVLDSARHPEIVYRSGRLALDPQAGTGGARLRGTARGRLALHGEERALDVPFEAERQGGGWHVRGRLRFKQSDFGIRPFSSMGGAVGVKDEVEVELDLTLRPRGEERAPSQGVGGAEPRGDGAPRAP
jgi:polyisoprenoid-binding protein YceI